MTIFDLIKQYIKIPISDDELESKSRTIASDLSLNLDDLYNPEANTFDEATVKFLAEEIDKNSAILTVPEVVKSELAEVTKTSKKNNKKNTPSAINQNIESLKPAVINLKTAVAGEADAMLQVFDEKSAQVENAVTARIMNRCKQINPNIISKVSAELQEYTNESASFRTEIGSIFDQAFADIINY